MNAKQMAALCSVLGLTLSGAAYADSAMSNGSNSKQGQKFEQGCPIQDNQVMSDLDSNGNLMVSTGINHPGRINCDGSWDLFATGSFIYWMASTDGLEFNNFAFNDA